MKTVFTNDMVAHVWAQQNQERGRSSNGNFSFEGSRLYSYSTCIAQFVKHGRKTVVLFDNHRYSNTTSSKHFPPARRATSHHKSFSVPNPCAVHANHHRANHDRLKKAVESAVNTAARNPKNWSYRHAQELINAANEYASLFGLKRKPLEMPTEDDLIELGSKLRSESAKKGAATIKRRQALRTNLAPEIERWRNGEGSAKFDYPGRNDGLTPTTIDKNARAMWNYRANYRGLYRNGENNYGFNAFESFISESDRVARRESLQHKIDEYCKGTADNPPPNTPLTQEQEDRRAAAVAPQMAKWAIGEIDDPPHGAKPTEKQKRQRATFEEKQLEQNIIDWRAGEGSAYSLNGTRYVFMRIRNGNVETSQGALFPIEDARRVFPIIQKCRDSHRGWKANGGRVRVGSFNLDSITDAGHVRAGCHFIQWPEIERTAIALGLIAPPSMWHRLASRLGLNK